MEGKKNKRVHMHPVLPSLSSGTKESRGNSDVIPQLLTRASWLEKTVLHPHCRTLELWTRARRHCGSVPLLLRCPHGNSNEDVDARAHGLKLHWLGGRGGDYMNQLLDWLQYPALEYRRQAQVSQTHRFGERHQMARNSGARKGYK